MSDYARNYAKLIFVHYFKLALTNAGVNWDSDYEAEIEEAIDQIFDAIEAK